jgi:hypothetical protein
MSQFPWHDAKQTLLRISQSEIQSFLQTARSRNIYGIGYFCHNSYGDVLLVANTTDYHKDSFRRYVERFGPCDEDDFRWDIGNWQYPAGIATGPGQQSFDYQSSWEPFRRAIDQTTTDETVDHRGALLRNLCLDVLQSLITKGIFDRYLPNLGFTVMDVDDPGTAGLETKKSFDSFVSNRDRQA